MNILVIGNGFDLAHGLSTSYKDFLDFVVTCRDYKTAPDEKSKYYNFCKAHNKTPIYNEILEHIWTNSELLDCFLEKYNELCATGKNGWIDFEKELSDIVKALTFGIKYATDNEGSILKIDDKSNMIIRKFVSLEAKDMNGPVYLPRDFMSGKLDNLQDGLRRIIRLLEIYLVEFVELLPISKEVPECKDVEFDHVISFNYTDTFLKLYDHDRRAKYCYIHGEAKRDGNFMDCDLVLGIDEFLNRNESQNNNLFIWSKKFYQRIYNGTGSDYIDWIEDCEHGTLSRVSPKDAIHNVYIYGHSLDVTDSDILSKILLMDKARVHVLYYSSKDLAQKITNAVKLIGEEELIKKKKKKKRTIVFEHTK